MVVDASIAIAWAFRDEQNRSARDVFQRALAAGAEAPCLWVWEIQSALHMAEYRGRLTPAESADLTAEFGSLPIAFSAPATLGTDLRLAQEHRLTPYDAAYLELALRKKLTLATLDRELSQAAASLGILADGL